MFDANCSIGHWPFRRLTRNTLPELKAYLSTYGITGGALSHNHAACYVNVQDANIELAEALRADGSDFFVGIGTINPAYPAWERDIVTCVRDFGFRGIRILPLYHNYLPNSHVAWELFDAAAELDVPIVFPFSIVNYRQRSWLEPEPVFTVQDMLATAHRFPKTRFLVTETAIPLQPSFPKNLYVEMSRFAVADAGRLEAFVGRIGNDRVLYGSGAPFREIEASLLKMHHAVLEPEARERIEHRNAEELFRISQ